MNTAVLFSSTKDDWRTPPELFAQLEAEFHFYIDGAASYKECAVRVVLRA
jgi:hypothetical protein